MSVAIFKFGQIFTIFEAGEIAKLQSASHANMQIKIGVGAIDGKIKCLQNVKDVDESVS